MGNLLAAQRQALTLERLRAQGAVRIAELTAELGVSEMTARRDIDQLAARRLCRKVHGGACLIANTSEEPGFAAKSSANVAAKRAIGRAAAALVSTGQAVGVSAGTTSYWVAVELAALVAAGQVTVVTNSPPAAEAIVGGPTGEFNAAAAAGVILTGGVRTPSQALVGPAADWSLGRLRLDWLFLGVHGLDPEAGLTTPNLLEAATDRAFMAAARATAVTADASKWGVAALARIAPLSDAARLVTDSPPPPAAAKALRRGHVDVTVALEATP